MTNNHIHSFLSKSKMFTITHLLKDDINNDYFNLLSQLTVVNIDVQKSKIQCEQLFDLLNENHMMFVLKCDDTIVGCGDTIVGCGTLLIEHKFIHNFGHVAHIEDIVIDTKYRGFGLGKEMINYLTNISKQRNCYKCVLDCSDENVAFYEKCGYNRKGSFMTTYFE